MKKLLILFIVIQSFAAMSYGQEVVVKAAFDSTGIVIGDQLNYRISVEQPAGTRLQLPFLHDTLCKGIDILSGPFTDTADLKNGRIKVNQKYVVTSFEIGTHTVPPAVAEINGGNNQKRFYSDYSTLNVKRVNITPPDTTAKIFDIVRPYKAPVTLSEILPWILLLGIIAVITWFAVRYFKKYGGWRRKTNAIETSADPAHVIAFRDLEKLKDEQLWQKGEIKKYYTVLTDILRQYLVNRYQVFSFEMTSSETLAELVKAGFKKDDSYNQLKNVLTGADLVKFAKYIPAGDENELNFKLSWDFVEATREAEELLNEELLSKKGGEEL